MKVKKQQAQVVLKMANKSFMGIKKRENKYSLRSKPISDEPKERAIEKTNVKSPLKASEASSDLSSNKSKKQGKRTVKQQENKYSLRSKRFLDQQTERTTESAIKFPTIECRDSQPKDISDQNKQSTNCPIKCDVEQTERYSLRTRPIVEKPEPTPKIVSTAVSEIGLSSQKQLIWSKCKKFADKSKFLEETIVFAKQVRMIYIHMNINSE